MKSMKSMMNKRELTLAKSLSIAIWLVIQLAAAGAANAALFPGKTLKINVTRDTWVSAAKGERNGNNGAAGRLKLKGQQEFTLIDIDTAPLKGIVIQKAILHFRSSTPDQAPVMRLGASTVATPWREGSSARYHREIGGACFSKAMYKLKNWAYPGSTVLDAVFGKGNTTWRFADCTPPGTRRYGSNSASGKTQKMQRSIAPLESIPGSTGGFLSSLMCLPREMARKG
jgi:hypothetical protein